MNPRLRGRLPGAMLALAGVMGEWVEWNAIPAGREWHLLASTVFPFALLYGPALFVRPYSSRENRARYGREYATWHPLPAMHRLGIVMGCAAVCLPWVRVRRWLGEGRGARG